MALDPIITAQPPITKPTPVAALTVNKVVPSPTIASVPPPLRLVAVETPVMS